jgi:hypothetical protein
MADFLELHDGVAPPLQIGNQAQPPPLLPTLQGETIVEEELIDCQETETPVGYEAQKPPSSANNILKRQYSR